MKCGAIERLCCVCVCVCVCVEIRTGSENRTGG